MQRACLVDQGLVDVAVEYRRVLVAVEDRERFVAACVDQSHGRDSENSSPVREHQERLVGRELGDLLVQPRELLLPETAPGSDPSSTAIRATPRGSRAWRVAPNTAWTPGS